MTKYRKHVEMEGTDKRILPHEAGDAHSHGHQGSHHSAGHSQHDARHPGHPMFSKKKLLISAIIIIVFAACLWYFTSPSKDYTEFAKCISYSGAKFYGTFWCPHCQDQKKMFGSAKEFLPYTECSTPDGNGQLQVCTDAGIKGYPTWIFADEVNLTGKVEFDRLAERTGCTLP